MLALLVLTIFFTGFIIVGFRELDAEPVAIESTKRTPRRWK